jgi:AcrR family transcriptional regulator
LIAAHSQVNPALVHHFFGTKEALFVASLQLPFNPSEAISRILDGPPGDVGERMVRFFLGVWGESESREAILAIFRSAMTHERAAGLMREFFTSTLLESVADNFGIPPARFEAAAGQLIGVALLRYVIQLEPLASADDEAIVSLLAPMVQAYLSRT